MHQLVLASITASLTDSIGRNGVYAGALAGWAIGHHGGRPLVERHGRWLHLSPHTFDRAERWFERRGSQAVLLGRLTPVVRSSIPTTDGDRSPSPGACCP